MIYFEVGFYLKQSVFKFVLQKPVLTKSVNLFFASVLIKDT